MTECNEHNTALWSGSGCVAPTAHKEAVSLCPRLLAGGNGRNDAERFCPHVSDGGAR